jgi:multiple sugar transport system ATP-binding protein
VAEVRLIHLTKKFPDVVAVNDLTMTVEDGSFTAMLGPSGCGKTTTLRCIAGLETPTSGEIYIGDRFVNDLSPAERDIAMVFQFYAIYPGMTVYENMAFPLKQRKVPKEEIRRKVKEVAEMLRIDHLLNEDAMSLTVGEKQRVALGRAMVRDPQVFLLDEPLTNLDARLRAIMRAELKRLHARLKTTIIFVTHDQVEAMAMADRIAVMSQGRLQQYDTPMNLYNHPKNLFVAGFVGSPTMNLLEATLLKEDGNATLDFGEFKLTLGGLSEALTQVESGETVVFGIRPNDIDVSKEKGEQRAMVEVVEPIGASTILDLRVGDHTFRALAPRAFRVQPGEEVWVSFDRNRLHLFSKTTEEALL